MDDHYFEFPFEEIKEEIQNNFNERLQMVKCAFENSKYDLKDLNHDNLQKIIVEKDKIIEEQRKLLQFCLYNNSTKLM